MNPKNPATSIGVRTRRLIATTGLAIAMTVSIGSGVIAAPDQPAGLSVPRAQNVDYIGVDASQWLDLGFTVLVPSWVPSPFGGSPSIDAGGGYYSLYWMNAGGDPTFLQVTGTVGGGLPAGSPYDLNNQLFINSSVMGYEAIHDVTPAYDAVWWIAGGVLYKVESRNSSVDSVSLANSLIAFVPAAGPEPTAIPVEPTAVPVEPTAVPVEPTPVPIEPTPVPSDPVPVDTDNGGGEPSDGNSGSENSDSDTSSDESSELPDQSAPSDNGSSEDSTDTSDAGPANSEPAATEEAAESVTSDGTGQPFASSDGTGGPRSVVIGGDGTGGTTEVVVRPRTNQGTVTP